MKKIILFLILFILPSFIYAYELNGDGYSLESDIYDVSKEYIYLYDDEEFDLEKITCNGCELTLNNNHIGIMVNGTRMGTIHVGKFFSDKFDLSKRIFIAKNERELNRYIHTDGNASVLVDDGVVTLGYKEYNYYLVEGDSNVIKFSDNIPKSSRDDIFSISGNISNLKVEYDFFDKENNYFETGDLIKIYEDNNLIKTFQIYLSPNTNYEDKYSVTSTKYDLNKSCFDGVCYITLVNEEFDDDNLVCNNCQIKYNNYKAQVLYSNILVRIYNIGILRSDYYDLNAENILMVDSNERNNFINKKTFTIDGTIGGDEYGNSSASIGGKNYKFIMLFDTGNTIPISKRYNKNDINKILTIKKDSKYRYEYEAATGNDSNYVKNGDKITIYENDSLIKEYTIEEKYQASSIKINKIDSIIKGETVEIPVTIEPDYVTRDSLIWESSDTSVATISSNGIVTGKSKGTTHIKVRTNNYSVYDEFDLLVKEPKVVSISASENNKFGLGQRIKLSDLVIVETEDEAEYTIEASVSSVFLEDNGDGTYTAKKMGNTNVYITVENKNITIPITIYGFNFPYKTSKMKKGSEWDFDVSFFSTNLESVNMKIEGDGHVAIISESGNYIYNKVNGGNYISVPKTNAKLKALSTGNVTITVKDDRYGIEDSMEIQIYDLDIDYGHTDKIVTIKKGESYCLAPRFTYEGSKIISSLEYNTSNSSIATVNSAGCVRGIDTGIAIIKGALPDSELEDYRIVHVINPITSISLNKTSATLDIGETDYLFVSINPTDAIGNVSVTWQSSNPQVATVNMFGIVSAISPGMTTITATIGDHTATYNLTVKSYPITSITLNKSTLNLELFKNYKLSASLNPTNTTDDKTIVWTSSNPEIASVDNDGKITTNRIGTTTITATASNGISVTCILNVTKVNAKSVSVLTVSNQIYTGKQIKPGISLKYSGITLKNGIDYTLSYGTNKKTGIGTIKITFKGSTYTGTRTVSFYIVPKKVTIYKPTTGKKYITAKWKKTTGATGYQVAYRIKGTSKWKYVYSTGSSRKISGLTKGKIYQIVVRAYKKVGSSNHYGPPSDIKTIKCK